MTAPAASRQNLLLGLAIAPGEPVFTGPQRTAALSLLGNAVVERQLMAVMKLLNKDPTLCLEQVPVRHPAAGRVDATSQVDFALACLDNDISAGYVFAIQRGYDASRLLMPALIKMGRRNSGVEEDLSLLLSMGADPNVAPGDESSMSILGTAMHLSYPAQKVTQYPGLVAMLLDAGASPEYHSNFMCPFQMLVKTGGWDDPKKEAQHIKQMARLTKAGLSLERRTGKPRMTPLMLALGSRNPHGLAALIRVGAKTDSQSLDGKNLYGMMEGNGLGDFKPMIQEALMERQIAAVKKDAPAEPATPVEVGQEPRSRRRLGSL